MPYWCTDCRSYFSVKTGTAMQALKIPMRKWAIAICLCLTSLKSISSMKLYRDLGVSQPTAWLMMHRIREAWACDEGQGPFDGPVEVDETYIGGKCRTSNKVSAKVVRELEPFSDRHEEVAACCRYFKKNIERMRYDECRDQGMQIGSGVVESGCRMFGLRLKRPGTRWSQRGASAMLALKTMVMNLRLPDFLDWRANQAVAA